MTVQKRDLPAQYLDGFSKNLTLPLVHLLRSLNGALTSSWLGGFSLWQGLGWPLACGMANVKKSCCSGGAPLGSEGQAEEVVGAEEADEKAKAESNSSPPSASGWRRYVPLIVLVGVALLAALAKQVHYSLAELSEWDLRSGMHDFMGLLLLLFSLLKLFDLEGFASGFQKYDLLAGKSRTYALGYPFLELALALGYLSRWQPQVVYLGTVLLMTFGALGVFRALASGKQLNCACMGSSLKVPLSTVAVVEDVGMAAMALAMLLL